MKTIMENPFEIIEQKLEKLTQLIEKLITNQIEIKKGNEKEIISIDEASSFLYLAKPTVYGYVSKRNIPHFKKGKRLYFIKEDLFKWVQEGKVKTVKEIENDARNYFPKKNGFSK
jgi:excisionase family DNA binding protein